MKLTIELSAALAERLHERAERLGITAEELARVAIFDLLAPRNEEFNLVLERVLKENGELYRRLAKGP